MKIQLNDKSTITVSFLGYGHTSLDDEFDIIRPELSVIGG